MAGTGGRETNAAICRLKQWELSRHQLERGPDCRTNRDRSCGVADDGSAHSLAALARISLADGPRSSASMSNCSAPPPIVSHGTHHKLARVNTMSGEIGGIRLNAVTRARRGPSRCGDEAPRSYAGGMTPSTDPSVHYAPSLSVWAGCLRWQSREATALHLAFDAMFMV